jgi:hypothetical protein
LADSSRLSAVLPHPASGFALSSPDYEPALSH